MTLRRLLAALAVGALLAGCEAPEPKTADTPVSPGSQLESHNIVRVVDVNVKGRTVTCVFWDGNEGSSTPSGLSCDWANAK